MFVLVLSQQRLIYAARAFRFLSDGFGIIPLALQLSGLDEMVVPYPMVLDGY